MNCSGPEVALGPSADLVRLSNVVLLLIDSLKSVGMLSEDRRVRGKRNWAFRGVVVGALLLGPMIEARPLWAARSPCTSDQATSHLHGAGSTTATDVFGAKATINSKDPALCGNTNVSVAWAFVDGRAADDGHAQVGYGRFGTNDEFPQQPGGFSVFSQWKACSTCPIHTVVTGNAPDGFNDYLVKYNSQTGKIAMFKNFTLVDQTFNFDAAVSWTSPWIPEFAAETKNPNTDIVGVASGHAKFNELRQVSRTGAFSVISGIHRAERNSVFRYHTDASGLPGRFEVWTDPL